MQALHRHDQYDRPGAHGIIFNLNENRRRDQLTRHVPMLYSVGLYTWDLEKVTYLQFYTSHVISKAIYVSTYRIRRTCSILP